jgi:hypothetical protein
MSGIIDDTFEMAKPILSDFEVFFIFELAFHCDDIPLCALASTCKDVYVRIKQIEQNPVFWKLKCSIGLSANVGDYVKNAADMGITVQETGEYWKQQYISLIPDHFTRAREYVNCDYTELWQVLYSLDCVNIAKRYNTMFLQVCKNFSVPIVSQLYRIIIDRVSGKLASIMSAMSTACDDGNFEMVKYLCNIPNIPIHDLPIGRAYMSNAPESRNITIYLLSLADASFECKAEVLNMCIKNDDLEMANIVYPKPNNQPVIKNANLLREILSVNMLEFLINTQLLTAVVRYGMAGVMAETKLIY